MKITLAKTAGFCMGVRNAIRRIINEINNRKDDILVFGPLIHNPQTLELLGSRGLRTIDNFDSIDGKTITIRTHGITQSMMKEIDKRAKSIINLTCPRVERVQKIIQKYSGEGCFTIIIGDETHAEVISLKSYATSGVFVISDEEDIDKIPLADKYIMVSQTTFEIDVFKKIESELKGRLSGLTVINTICNATYNRQGEVKDAIKKGVDALVVVGGKNSANTQRLVQIGKSSRVKTLPVETEFDLNEKDFININELFITAGASTPGWIINNILEKLFRISVDNGLFIFKYFLYLLELLVRLNIFSATCAFLLCLFVHDYLGVQRDYGLAFVSLIYIFSMSIVEKYYELDSLRIVKPTKFEFYRGKRIILYPLAVIILHIAFIIISQYDSNVIAIFVIVSLFSFISFTKRVRLFFNNSRLRLVKNLNRFMNTITPIGWVIVTTVIPLIAHKAEGIYIVVLSLFIYCFAYLRSTLLDIIDYQVDQIMGKNTFPILLGLKKTKNISLIISFISIIVFGCFSHLQLRPFFIIYIAVIFYFIILLVKIMKHKYIISLKYEILIELNLLFLILFSIIFM